MDPVESERMSLLLSRYLDGSVGLGTQDAVETRRLSILVRDSIYKYSNDDEEIFSGGSSSDGFVLKGSDIDFIYIDNHVVVIYPGQFIHPDCIHKTVLYMREADNCRPGYATLQLGQLGHRYTKQLFNSLLTVTGSIFLSSDMFREEYVSTTNEQTVLGIHFASSGPSSTVNIGTMSMDMVSALHCINWPRQANEWTTRQRPYGWPSQTLIHTIVQGGCHLVPVGDKCSDDTRLQWRISFVKAERMLVHNFDHVQFKVYGLLKYLLKQLKSTLQEVIGDDDILCSYFLKIVMFTAIENTHKKFWQEKHIFSCFWFCFSILMTWVKVGYCPNYFITANNMFQRKVHGLNQLKLLRILHDVYLMKWKCLSIGTFFSPTIWEWLCDSDVQYEIMHQKPQKIEMNLVKNATQCITWMIGLTTKRTKALFYKALCLLSKSQSTRDEHIIYCGAVRILSTLAMQVHAEHTLSTGNKARYRNLKRCKRWLAPRASIGTDILYMATFYFQTGNYRRCLEICEQVRSSVAHYSGNIHWSPQQNDRYMHNCCGKGYNLIQKMNMLAFGVEIEQIQLAFCVPQLHLELMKSSFVSLRLPPLPYAVFLSFLCSHELGDTRGRDAALRDLIGWTYDEQQGGHKHWIVHTLLGICYQTVGDNSGAISSYWDSLRVDQLWNPALERIEALQKSVTG